MPVSDEHAMRQFEIEALRQITDNLRRLNDAQAEQGRVLHSIDNRLVRIESSSVAAKVSELECKVDLLEAERDRRAGALRLVEWIVKHWPAVIGFLLLVAVILKSSGVIKL